MCAKVMTLPAKPLPAFWCPAPSHMATRSFQSGLINGTAQHSVSVGLGLSDLSQCKSKLLLVEPPGPSAGLLCQFTLHCGTRKKGGEDREILMCGILGRGRLWTVDVWIGVI